MRIGQYELLERIAIGGMAEVYRGRVVGEEGFEKSVAIKRIHPSFARDTRFVKMLVTEARIHVQLAHRNIVQIHDLGISEEGEYFIVLEYMDGPDLARLLDRVTADVDRTGAHRRLSDAVAIHVAIEIGEGLHFAHELRDTEGQPLALVHRDVAPSNVLLSYAGEVKLSDFGLAKRRTDHSVVGSLKGSLTYMSPEQARRVSLDRRSDVFSLGAVLFEMLTGHRLREMTDELQGWKQVASGLVPSIRAMRPDIPPVLDRLVAAALEPDLRDRFQDANAFVTAARKALELVPRCPSGETAELQETLRRAIPVGSPRPSSEGSKVIRLASEFVNLSGLAAKWDGTTQTAFKSAFSQLPAFSAVDETEASTRRLTVDAAKTKEEKPETPPPSTAQHAEATNNSVASSAPELVKFPAGRFFRLVPRSFRLALVGVFGLVVLGAFIHVAIIPLPVLVLWRKPIRLEIGSDPKGADVYLDGQRLRFVTPISIEIERDRKTHEVEIRKDNYLPIRRSVRFDEQAVPIAFSFAMRPVSRPQVESLRAPPAVVPAHTVPAVEPATAVTGSRTSDSKTPTQNKKMRP